MMARGSAFKAIRESKSSAGSPGKELSNPIECLTAIKNDHFCLRLPDAPQPPRPRAPSGPPFPEAAPSPRTAPGPRAAAALRPPPPASRRRARAQLGAGIGSGGARPARQVTRVAAPRSPPSGERGKGAAAAAARGRVAAARHLGSPRGRRQAEGLSQPLAAPAGSAAGMSQVPRKLPQEEGDEEEEEEEEIVGLAGYADGAESFSDGDAESGGDEAFLDFNDPFSTEVKPRILLMGLRRSGKSSIQKVVFHKMSPNETLFLESTNKICREDVSNSSFVNFQIWDFPGQIDFFDPTFDYEMIFRGTGALIFVIDSQDDYMEALARLHLTVTRAYKVNPDINFEIFIHKVDGLSDDHKIETQRDIHQRANDDLADAGLEKIHLSFYLTSIYDHSIFEAFSKVVQKLIPQLPTLENLLNIFISNSGIEKAFLFDVVSKIYIATDSTPVDMQTYELCCDMIDVVIDISCIYGLKDDGTGTPYDKESMAIIKLNNTTVLYLKEVTKFLALVCFVREESFERKGLIDYNFHCFRKAIQEVFEVRMKVVRSRKHQSHVQKNKRPTPNGTPRMPL
ncbi:LOW QUALITY PROTEIN: ras-related GTP-binding protein D [Tympanuchus pallidicinctus]|uniref:LOW QUALITY PROTEIN: ras-related GTP-binding protein D n=1 Tax=Tympanuchus pallidicinctus TaxID=109042 RepID=UPI0022872A25|nr:LOW QUALITY PROTEIN: ras-related GTP-binding protein D [Tympanuchus pallidicinctus]